MIHGDVLHKMLQISLALFISVFVVIILLKLL